MKHGEALFLAPLLAFASMQSSRAQETTPAVPEMCTTEGATLEDGESANGRNVLTRLEGVAEQIRAAASDAERDQLFQEFLIPALSCTTADVDAAQVTLSRRPIDPKHPVDVADLRETLSVFRDVLAVQELPPLPDESEQPGFQEEIPALIPAPLFSRI